MRKLFLFAVLLAVVFLLGARSREVVSYWKTNAYQVSSTFGAGKVQIYFVEKDPNTNADILRCGQKINSARARELAIDLVEAADDADGTENR